MSSRKLPKITLPLPSVSFATGTIANGPMIKPKTAEDLLADIVKAREKMRAMQDEEGRLERVVCSQMVADKLRERFKQANASPQPFSAMMGVPVNVETILDGKKGLGYFTDGSMRPIDFSDLWEDPNVCG